jgi:hypothetical protein
MIYQEKSTAIGRFHTKEHIYWPGTDHFPLIVLVDALTKVTAINEPVR